jgi:hypothetical protein
MFDGAGAADPLDHYRDCDDDALVDAFTQLGALERAVRAQRLAVLAVLDERQAWIQDGATDVVAWVAGLRHPTFLDPFPAANPPMLTANARCRRVEDDRAGVGRDDLPAKSDRE